MNAMSARQWQWLGMTSIGLLTLYRILVSLYGDIPVDIEEAYYLSWTEQLEWGYFSKPPLLTALLAFVTHLLGDAAWVFKSLAAVLYGLTALAVMGLANILSQDGRIAALSGVSFALMPLVAGLSLFISTDAPLMLFWALAMMAFIKAVRTDQWHWWLLLGVVAGLGMLSKYTFGVLAVGMLGYLLNSGRGRLLLSLRLWVGLLLAVLLWLPNLWWLFGHDFITFAHTKHISGVAHAGLHWVDLRDFLFSQLGIFGPVMAIIMLLGMRHRAFWRGDSRVFLLWASLPLLLLIAIQALSSEANINWAGPAFIGLVVLMVDWMLRADWKAGGRWLNASVVLHLVLMVLVYHYHWFAAAMSVELTRKTDPFFKRLGWEQVAKQLLPLREHHPQAALVSSDRKLLALLGYHTRAVQPVIRRAWNPDRVWHNQYDLYNNLADHQDAQFLLLSSTLLPPDTLGRFDQVAPPKTLHAQVYADLSVTVYVYWAQGFKGYAK